MVFSWFSHVVVSDRCSRGVRVTEVPGSAADGAGVGENVVRRPGGVRVGFHAGPEPPSTPRQRREKDEQLGVVRVLVLLPQSTSSHRDLQGKHRIDYMFLTDYRLVITK